MGRVNPPNAKDQGRSAARAFRVNSGELLLRFKTRSDIVHVMAHLSAGVEYGIHCLLWLAGAGEAPMSGRELAELQGLSPTFIAKIFAKLEKAGIVRASEGVKGGYLLARPPERISFLDVMNAVEGDKRLFECREIRGRCALFGESPPDWATRGTCSIHAVMLRAEAAMRDVLAERSLADVGRAVERKAPPGFGGEVRAWIDERIDNRTRSPVPSMSSMIKETPQ